MDIISSIILAFLSVLWIVVVIIFWQMSQQEIYQGDIRGRYEE